MKGVIFMFSMKEKSPMHGERLKKLRKDKKLTQTQLGEKINVTKVSISGYESGDRSPDTDNLRRLADFFGVTTDYLLGRSDDPELTEKEEDEKLYKELDEILDNLPEDERNRLWAKIKAYAEGLADANKEN